MIVEQDSIEKIEIYWKWPFLQSLGKMRVYYVRMSEIVI
jgi:hypothetical protein